MTTAPEDEAIVGAFFDRLSAGDLGVVDERVADEFAVSIDRKGTAESAIGTDGVEAIYREYYTAFSDCRHEIDETVAEGDLVGAFVTSVGPHEGEFRSVRPTGNEIAIEDTGSSRIDRGQIVDARPQSDLLGSFEQIGVGVDR